MLRHYVGEGLGKMAIAAKLGVSRRTVHRYVVNDKEEPRYGPRLPRPSKLDPYKGYLRGRLQDYSELTGIRLLAEIQALGYKSRYSIPKGYLRARRPKPPLPLEQRFEVEPGEQAQVDSATFKTSFGTVYALLVVLSWSRTLWVRFGMHQGQLTLLSGLHQSFLASGGVPRTLLFDRMKTAVAGFQPGGAAIFNPEMLRFASHYGFRPVACRPYRAKTKGRVERAVSYLRSSFFYGRTFRDLEDLNTQVSSWLEEMANARVHGTTGEVPSERLTHERSHLKPLPAEAYVPMVVLARRLTRDGFISYNGNEYSLPDGLTRAGVEVRVSLGEVRLFQDGQLIASHPALDGRGHRLPAPEHRRRHDSASHLLKIDPPVDQVVIEAQHRSLEVYEEALR